MIRNILSFASALFALAVIAAGVLPLLRTNAWWVRMLDFPRLQLLIAALFGIAFVLMTARRRGGRTILITALAMVAAWDLWLLGPTLVRPALTSAPLCGEAEAIRVLTVNVKLRHEDAGGLIGSIRAADPDVIVAQETDAWWNEALAALDGAYPHREAEITGGFFGMHLFSKLPLASVEVRYPTDPDTPVMDAVVQAPFGPLRVIAVHPRPPQVGQSSLPRDAELYAAALDIDAGAPSVMLGDFNAVPWERTMRRVRRLAGLIDPRATFGFAPSFDAQSRWMKWPLDHILHSASLAAAEARLLPDFGSDHLPWMVTLCPAEVHQRAPAPHESDVETARAVIARGSGGTDAPVTDVQSEGSD